eukprot:jgi/Botrbrau1/14953/Bobra.0018s0056.1
MLGTQHNLVRRGSAKPGLAAIPDIASKEEMKAKSTGTLGWQAIAKLHVVDYTVLLVMFGLLCWSEDAEPFHRVIYAVEDEEYWRYSYPLVLGSQQHVPSWTVHVLATMGPTTVFLGYALLAKPSRLELHNTVLGCFSSVLTTGVVTNLVKLGVGRPRPNFMKRCWPDGGPPAFDEHGMAKCAGNAVGPWEGRKSFPSGHTSWSTSGLGYLSLWIAGKLKCWDGEGHPWRLHLSALPLCGAIWIGITRLQDYWHHWEDVVVGFFLGLGLAYAFYRQHFPPLTSPRSGSLILAPQGPEEFYRTGASLSAALDDELAV